MSGSVPFSRIVVLMLENRSFDHMVGFLKGANYPIDGLNGTESNPQACGMPASPRVQVSPTATPITATDPGHEFEDVNLQLFCKTNPGGSPVPTNEGFVSSYAGTAGSVAGPEIMQCFDPSRVPVLVRLAQEFAICDRWFSSVPGPTWPNRFFVHAATSDGVVQMGLKFYLRSYPMRTIYENLAAAGKTWTIYFHDIPQALAMRRLRSKKNRRNFHKFARFEPDARSGNLSSYVFIEPRYFNFFKKWQANDQHPNHDVRWGEALISDVYETLRTSPEWETTLLVVTFDEHGGFYDHVLPPGGVPSPDGKQSRDPGFEFKFDRLGLRVPTVLVSPLIPKGTIDSTVYEHSSILATAREAYGLPRSLTKRDEWANPIDLSYWLAKPRDTPAIANPHADFELAEYPVAEAEPSEIALAMAREEQSIEPPSDLQRSLVALADSLEPSPELGVLEAARQLPTEHDAAVHVRASVARFMARR